MSIICTSSSSSLLFFPLSNFTKPISSIVVSCMAFSTSKPMKTNNVNDQNAPKSLVYNVPEYDQNDINAHAKRTFRRYTNNEIKGERSGKGVSIVWFRHDLRVLDNEALFKAWSTSEFVLPVYCLDPRQFGSTHYFGFPKTGAPRAQFLIECLADLRKNLQDYGLNLLIQHGKPEEVLPLLAMRFGVHTIYAHRETCSEELNVEARILKCPGGVSPSFLMDQSSSSKGATSPKLELIWGCTLYHLDDLPFDPSNIPDVYTQFRKSVESKCTVRSCVRLPESLGPPPKIEDWGCIPSVDQLGLLHVKADRGLVFTGGESAALSRVHEYFWQKDLLKVYKETRNGMLGSDYSTKFSPWLACGSLSPRLIYEEVKRYEKEWVANDSTYWLLFELIWRDYFRFLSIKYGNSIFQLGGPRKLQYKWNQDSALFEAWKEGKTGYPLIDANMKELLATGFMSNRGRQIVCSFLVRDMGIDWRMGAEWFETCLLDYDPCSNYGNWTYGAGVGNDPREDRYFSIPKQAQVYDPEGKYVAYWLPELRRLPKDKRHSPGFSYLKPVVPLKHGQNSSSSSYNGHRNKSGWEPNKFYRR